MNPWIRDGGRRESELFRMCPPLPALFRNLNGVLDQIARIAEHGAKNLFAAQHFSSFSVGGIGVPCFRAVLFRVLTIGDDFCVSRPAGGDQGQPGVIVIADLALLRYVSTKKFREPVEVHQSAARGKRIVYCPAESLVTNLCDHFVTTEGGQLNKNFRIEAFAALPDAIEVPC